MLPKIQSNQHHKLDIRKRGKRNCCFSDEMFSYKVCESSPLLTRYRDGGSLVVTNCSSEQLKQRYWAGPWMIHTKKLVNLQLVDPERFTRKNFNSLLPNQHHLKYVVQNPNCKNLAYLIVCFSHPAFLAASIWKRKQKSLFDPMLCV